MDMDDLAIHSELNRKFQENFQNQKEREHGFGFVVLYVLYGICRLSCSFMLLSVLKPFI